jgi:hypothetical protein
MLLILAASFSVAGNNENNIIKIENNEIFFRGSSPPEIWNQTYGGDYYDSGFSVQQTNDGGYIFAGATIPSGATYTDVYLVKTDVNGNVEWSKNHGGSDAEYGYSVQQTSDGGYIVAGYIYYYDTYDAQVLVLKTDSSGDQEWMGTIGGPELDEGFSVQQTRDKGYIITGFTDSYSTSRDVYLIRIDSTGQPIWEKTFGGGVTNIGNCVRQTSDGGYIIAGSTDSGGDSDVWMIKTDSDGTKEWDRKHGGAQGDWANSIRQTSDGGYIIAGATLSYGAGSQDVWLIKTDSVGIRDWDETFGGTSGDRGEEVQETSDGGYIVVGVTSSFGAGMEDAYLIRTDGSGAVLWTKTIGGALNEQGHSVFQTSDDDYIVAGETLSYGTASSYDAWLIEVRWGNNPPNKPSRPSGKLIVKLGSRETYSSSAIDPDGDQVLLLFDWGDGSFSDWLGPHDSGDTVESRHSWYQKGSFQIKVKAMDVLDAESVWSDPLIITVTKSRNKFFHTPLFSWLERYPSLFPLLRYLLGL